MNYMFLLGTRASLVAQLVKNLPAMWETWVQSLSWKDSLKKGKATHSWHGEFHGLYGPQGCRVRHAEQLSLLEDYLVEYIRAFRMYIF